MGHLPRKPRLAAVPLALACAFTAHAQQIAVPLRAELDGSFHEVVQEEVSVSGTVVVGVAAAGALSGPATLAGLVIPASAMHVCLTVLSRDGVYFSRNSYRVPDRSETPAGGFVLLPFDGTSRRDLISGYADGELAVRATPGSCETTTATYLVASTQPEFGRVDVLVNSFGANTVYYRTDDGSEGDCSEFTEGRRTSFDYRCEIDAARLSGDAPVVVIERERYGRPLAAVEIRLRLTAEP